jgi:predicted NBD/HSP70 family sugar kinase
MNYSVWRPAAEDASPGRFPKRSGDPRQPASSRSVRLANERRVFHLIRQHGPLSRTALVQKTGLSAQAIGSTVRRLLVLGLVEETGPERRSGIGRTPVGVAIVPTGAYAFGCSVERDRIDAAWIDLAGTPLASETARLVPGEDPRRTIARIERIYARLSAKANLRSAPGLVIATIGLGLPGPIDFQNGRLVNPPNFPSWEGVEPRSLFSDSWRLPVMLENSATASALGEAWRSRGALTNFLYCHWGLGVGGGLVREFESFRGETGGALELGHVPVVPDGEPCACGGRGCLEAEASVAAITRQASALGFHRDFDELVAEAPGNTTLSGLFERAGKLLGQALVGALNLLDVDAVVLGGQHFQQASEWLLPSVTRAVGERPVRRVVRPITVQTSSLGEAAGAVGAASVVFDRLLPSAVGDGRVQRRPPEELLAG